MDFTLGVQEFAHPQARFMHEKRRPCRLPPKIMAAANRQSYVAIEGAMFTVTVGTDQRTEHVGVH